MNPILIIGGTVDARCIAARLSEYDIHVTVTTDLARQLLGDTVKIHVGKLDAEQMAQLIRDINAELVLDASHPFAVDASRNAMAACHNTNTEYIRYQRKDTGKIPGVYYAGDFKQCADMLSQVSGNIFAAIGSNHLESFTALDDYQNRLFVRVLPHSRILEKCEGLGIKNVIAMKGPFSTQMNIAMFEYANAACLVTKDSGRAGGVNEKVLAAQSMGIKTILIEQPVLDYPKAVDDIAQLIKIINIVERG